MGITAFRDALYAVLLTQKLRFSMFGGLLRALQRCGCFRVSDHSRGGWVLGCVDGIGFCGADRDRTDDLRLAKPALSQLSYSP
jgi:hypothetical protein